MQYLYMYSFYSIKLLKIYSILYKMYVFDCPSLNVLRIFGKI